MIRIVFSLDLTTIFTFSALRSKPSTEQHGSLSTRQQLLNSQNSLESARKRAQFQRKAGNKRKADQEVDS